MHIPPHVFHHFNNAPTFSLQSSSQLGCANYSSHMEGEIEDDESANQHEIEENKKPKHIKKF